MVTDNESLDSATFLENKNSISSIMLPKYLDVIAFNIYTALQSRDLQVLYKSKGVLDFQGSPIHYFWLSTFQSPKYGVARQIIDSILPSEFMQNYSVFLTGKFSAWIIGKCSYKGVVTQ